MNFTGIARLFLARRAKEVRSWKGHEALLQERVLRKLLDRAAETEFGREYNFRSILVYPDLMTEYAAKVPMRGYEDFRDDVMRMITGERDVLWPGVCRSFAQSSGTTGGRSKYIPVTTEGLHENHYKGASYSVALYLDTNRKSRMFAGKGLILGGSFANKVIEVKKGVLIGDLSATLIQRIYPLANIFRVPDKRTALLEDWEIKLPILAQKAARSNITNISGVPSWMMTVIHKVLDISGKNNLKDVWPNLEVFFHGGISFQPYLEEYKKLCRGLDMHWSEVYNASEGYFAVSDNSGEPGMLLLVDAGVYFEFLPLGAEKAKNIREIEIGKVYELIISTVNGLWRYRTGDTVKIESLSPLKITIAGRTKSYINAFGEELMEQNADQAIAEACRLTGASILNYTAAPQYAHDNQRGRHQWIIEWKMKPESIEEFTRILDDELRKVNSDYDAKRSHDIFLDMLEIVTARPGLFDLWLSGSGSGKLGGQRKIPRLNNSREIADRLLELNEGC